MIGDAEAFERAIRADPGERTAQLVYADWLDENGDPDFAAVIRADEQFRDVAMVAIRFGRDLKTARTWTAAARGVMGSFAAVGRAYGSAIRPLTNAFTSIGHAYAAALTPRPRT